MSFQWVFDNAETLSINKNPVISQTITRDQTVRSASRGGHRYRFTIKIPGGFRYSAIKEILANLDSARLNRQEVNLSKAGYDYITRYQGEFTTEQLAALNYNYNSSTHNNWFTITGLPSTSITPSDTVIFRPGDIIMVQENVFDSVPYTITNTVYRTSGSSTTAVVNRPIVNTPLVTLDAAVAGDVKWQVVCTNMPQWTLVEHDRVEFNGPFEFYEDLGGTYAYGA